MGPGRGRDAALTPALAETLARVAALLAEAEEPWWVIGSAAVVLHGGATEARDVDVLLAIGDAGRLARRLRLPDLSGDGDALFRSGMLLRWAEAPLAVEFMAGVEVRVGADWRPVRSATRVVRGGVHLPAAPELRAMLATFGRPKDLARIALLTPACGTA